MQYLKTFNQVVTDGHRITEKDDSQVVTVKGNTITIWEIVWSKAGKFLKRIETNRVQTA